MLHTLIPHEHLRFSSYVAYLSAPTCETSIFKGIQLSLGLDHGNGHFEHYLDTEQVNIDIALPGDALEFSISVTSLKTLISSSEKYSAAPVSFCLLRGPPTV